SYSLANRTHISIVEKLSAFSVHQHQESRHDLMLSLWPYAPHCAQLCLVPAHPSAPLVKEKAGTECAQTRPAFPSLGGSVDACHLSVRVRPAPLSPTGLCHRRTSGGQGVTQKTNHRTNTAGELEPTTRSH